MGEVNNKTPQEHLLEIKKLGNTPVAVTQIQELLVNFPNFIPGWIELGLIYRKLGDRPSSLNTFSQALKVNPNDIKIKLELSIEQLHLNQFDKCRQSIQELLEIDPENVWAMLRLGELERTQNNRNEALKAFQKALELSPENIWAHIHVGIELGDAGKFTEAEEQLKTALESHPNHFQTLMQLGELEQKRQQPEQAIIYFQKVREIYPDRIEPALKIVEILRGSRNFSEAEHQLNQLLEKSPENFYVLMEFGHLERQREHTEQALKWFSLGSKKAPNYDQAINAQLFVIEELRELGKIEEAVANIEPILKQNPHNIRAKLIYGTLLKQQFKFETAKEIYQDILTLDPKNIYAHLELATYLGEIGQTQSAIEILEKAKNNYPNNLYVWLHLGCLYRQQQDRKQALEHYQKCLEIEPQNLWANLETAGEFRELGNFTAAEKQIYKTLESHPNNFHALMQLGVLEQTRHRLSLALECFQTVIENYPDRIEPYLKKLDILTDLESFNKANNTLEILQQNFPEEASLYISAGKLERTRGNREKALQYFRLAQEKTTNPAQNLEAQILAVEELRDLGNLDQALQLINKIIEQFPNSLHGQMVKGIILQKQPDLVAAANLYQAILTTQPNHLSSRIELARVYSQSGQIPTAIALLEETYTLLGTNINILIQLGNLYHSLENQEIAQQWYEKACQEHPDSPHGYISLANLMFLAGDTDSAIKLLQEAQTKIPLSPQITLKLIDLHMGSGNFKRSYEILRKSLNISPRNINLQWKLASINMAQGNYALALEILEKISTDNQEWVKQTEQIRADVYFYQCNYQKAEEHFQKAISLTPIATHERSQLATIFMLTGRIQEARQQLKIATEELNLKTPPGKFAIPLKSLPAQITNQLRMNPQIMAKLQAAQQETPEERILKLSSLITQEPNYVGSALYLVRELREQGIFEDIQQSLSQNPGILPSIPKRIVQFWNEPEPPKEILQTCQTWIDLNPGYEYICFNLDTAFAFLQANYDDKVLKAFANCDQPATQADLFRLAYLNKMGGFYADADDICFQSLDTLINLNPELIVFQEYLASIGNNFLGCIPGQNVIRTAFYQAVNNLTYYYNEVPWFRTGPGLMTSIFASSLVPYLTYKDYQAWPRILVLSQSQWSKFIYKNDSLAYKRTNKSWQQKDHHRKIGSVKPLIKTVPSL